MFITYIFAIGAHKVLKIGKLHLELSLPYVMPLGYPRGIRAYTAAAKSIRFVPRSQYNRYHRIYFNKSFLERSSLPRAEKLSAGGYSEKSETEVITRKPVVRL